MVRQLHIPSVKLLSVAFNSDDEKFFGERFQQQNLNYCLERQRFTRHPNGSGSRLNTDQLFLAASASLQV